MIARMMTGRKVVLGTLIILLALIPQFVTAAETCEERETVLQQAVTVQDYEQFIADNSPCELAFVAVQRLAAKSVIVEQVPLNSCMKTASFTLLK